MPLHPRHVPAPTARAPTRVPIAGGTKAARPAGPPRGALWHAIQLKAAKAAGHAPAAASVGRASGLPVPLQAGIERLSGVAMDGVRVHRDSPEPAKLGALAFARGRDIHLGPGQERHLPHEAWHVVQQSQGRVGGTAQLKGGPRVNDEAGLEQEADRMGARALAEPAPAGPAPRPLRRLGSETGEGAAVQLVLNPEVYPTRYKGPLTDQYRVAVGQVLAVLNERVYAAYEQSLQWQTLANHNAAHVQRWHEIASSFAANPDQEPRIISARFGYSIETIACGGLNNSVQRGLTISTQVAHGHTRPDVVLSAGNEEIAWIDITSTASTGHIRGKEGAGWSSRPFVYELVYPQLDLRALLNAANDPYYAERGAHLAGERQIELEVKEAKAKQLRDILIKLQADNGWSTGSGNAADKRKATRDAFHIEAANEGLDEEAAAMKNTRGALEHLGINPGPYGFNRGNIQSSNQRIHQVIDRLAEDEIEEGQGQLHSGTTRRIIGELRQSNVPRALRESLQEEYLLDPTARGTALAAMALKGVDEDIPRLRDAERQLRGLNPQDNRVPEVTGRVRRQAEGPASIDHQAILTWRREAADLVQRTQALEDVLAASDALNRFANERGIGFFQRPQVMTNFFIDLARNPPNAQLAQAVMRWIRQQELNEAIARLQRMNQALDNVLNFVAMMLDGRDRRVAQLERDVRAHLGNQPAANVGAINLWVARAQQLDQRRGALHRALQVRNQLRDYVRQHGINMFNGPNFNQWFQRLDNDPPNLQTADEAALWLAERAREEQERQQEQQRQRQQQLLQQQQLFQQQQRFQQQQQRPQQQQQQQRPQQQRPQQQRPQQGQNRNMEF